MGVTSPYAKEEGEKEKEKEEEEEEKEEEEKAIHQSKGYM